MVSQPDNPLTIPFRLLCTLLAWAGLGGSVALVVWVAATVPWSDRPWPTVPSMFLLIVSLVNVTFWLQPAVEIGFRTASLYRLARRPDHLAELLTALGSPSLRMRCWALQMLAELSSFPFGRVESWPVCLHTQSQIDTMIQLYRNKHGNGPESAAGFAVSSDPTSERPGA